MSGNRSIKLSFGMCEVCGKRDGRPGHECDGGEALRKSARELFGPAMDLVENLIAKAGTGVLRGVFEVAYERDALREALTSLVAQHDRPHGFDDEAWYAREVAQARAALAKVQS